MLKARVLVKRFLTQPVWIRYISTTSISIIEHYFKLPSWYRHMKFFDINWNWSLLLMTFLISLLSIFSRTIGLNAFEELYNALSGLEIIIDANVLKWYGQWPSLMHTLAILIRFLRHTTPLMIILRCLQDSLSSPEIDELLYFNIALVNFFWEWLLSFDWLV